MPATTVGKGKVGFAMSGEAPVLDLIAENDSGDPDSTSAISYGAAPAAAATLTLSFGLGDDTDLEVAAEGALYYFILPLPTGGSLGLRHHIAETGDLDLGIAARIGWVGSTDDDSNGAEYGASATYGAVQAILQKKTGAIRPMLSLNLMPAHIQRKFTDEPDYDYTGFATSITAGLMFVGRQVMAGPYITGTNFYSDRFDNIGWFASGGIMIALRPDRQYKPVPLDPPPAYPAPYAPQPYPPAQPQPYPQPYPPAQPQPYPPAQPQPYPPPQPAQPAPG